MVGSICLYSTSSEVLLVQLFEYEVYFLVVLYLTENKVTVE